MELLVHPLNRTIAVTPGANLLEVLREHQVPISYSCTAGRCGTCRCKVKRGRLLESGAEAKITNPGEGRFVLACTSTIVESCEIEIPEPDEIVIHPARTLKTSVVAIDTLTHDIRRLRLRSAKPLDFSPGQYANLQFSPEHVRPYSMAGLANDDELEFHVRVVPGGRVSGYVAHHLKVGDPVRVSGPLGTAYLRTRHDGPMLCIAGGTGLAPVLSIVRGALAAGMRNPIHLYFGARAPEDIYGADQLAALRDLHPALHLHTVVAGGCSDPRMRRGLVTEAVDADWSGFAGWRAYVCGAPAMVEAAALLLKRKGMQPEHLYADAFYPVAN